MKQIDQQTLERITGGFTAWMALGIASVVIFLSGFLDGIVRPKSCTD